MNMSEFFYDDATEKPLERMAPDGGMGGILERVACIGDSLDSGEIEVFEENQRRVWIDKFEISWLSYFGRVTGNTVHHFTRGGMSAREYVESFADYQGYWDRSLACRAYVITLGVNDISQLAGGKLEFGSMDDIDLSDWRNNKHTFVGYYGTIIQRYREISPRCRIFLVASLQQRSEKRAPWIERHRQFLYEIAKAFPMTYVMDFVTYGPAPEDDFWKKFYMNGHMTPAGYLVKGRLYTAYIDWIIRHNLADFDQIALQGGELHDPKYVW